MKILAALLVLLALLLSSCSTNNSPTIPDPSTQLPVYPGADQVSVRPLTKDEAPPFADHKERTEFLTTADEETIFDYYRDKLGALNWKVQGAEGTGSSNRLIFQWPSECPKWTTIVLVQPTILFLQPKSISTNLVRLDIYGVGCY